MPDARPPVTKPDIGATMQTASMIWQSISEVASGAIIGWVLDWAFDTDRIFLLICGLIGIGVGMTTFIRTALKESRKAAQESLRFRSHRNPDGPGNTGDQD
ncbi:MAG: AtpZ/AtpI family protein [Phycisphaerales bacterium]|nr:AtpZ/AtpI family protein [Phycisphaerales bacterium]